MELTGCYSRGISTSAWMEIAEALQASRASSWARRQAAGSSSKVDTSCMTGASPKVARSRQTRSCYIASVVFAPFHRDWRPAAWFLRRRFSPFPNHDLMSVRLCVGAQQESDLTLGEELGRGRRALLQHLDDSLQTCRSWAADPGGERVEAMAPTSNGPAEVGLACALARH